jgi:hypothetical protein
MEGCQPSEFNEEQRLAALFILSIKGIPERKSFIHFLFSDKIPPIPDLGHHCSIGKVFRRSQVKAKYPAYFS